MTDLDVRRLDHLTRRPGSVPDAIDRAVRIDAVSSWLSDLRDAIRTGYLDPLADEIEATTGGAFNVPVKGVGRAYRTDPEARASVTNVQTFARWYVREILDDDPDDDGDPRIRRYGPDGEVVRQLTAKLVDPTAILDTLDLLAEPDDLSPLDLLRSIEAAVEVGHEWIIAEKLVDRLIADERIRLVAADDAWVAVDTTTGATVPGLTVSRSTPTLTVRPDADAKRRVRNELDELLGPPTLIG